MARESKNQELRRVFMTIAICSEIPGQSVEAVSHWYHNHRRQLIKLTRDEVIEAYRIDHP